MERIFRAQKMLNRIVKEGKQNLLDEETKQFILSLDGKPANDYNFRSVVYDEPLAWIADATMKNGGVYVNIEDCE